MIGKGVRARKGKLAILCGKRGGRRKVRLLPGDESVPISNPMRRQEYKHPISGDTEDCVLIHELPSLDSAMLRSFALGSLAERQATVKKGSDERLALGSCCAT